MGRYVLIWSGLDGTGNIAIVRMDGNAEFLEDAFAFACFLDAVEVDDDRILQILKRLIEIVSTARHSQFLTLRDVLPGLIIQKSAKRDGNEALLRGHVWRWPHGISNPVPRRGA